MDLNVGGISLIMQAAQGLGLELTAEAYASMSTMPESHIAELLQSVASKVAKGTLNNPSNYICAAIKRGYQSNDQWSIAKESGVAPPPNLGPTTMGVQRMSEVAWGEESSEEGNLALQLAMQTATVAGVLLTQEAANALMAVPSQMAASILDYVAQKNSELRDPSNYIIATVAKKVSDKGKGKDFGKGAPSDFGGGDKGKGKGKGRRPMIPPDISPIELKCVEVNGLGHWGDQAIDLATLMAFRTLPLEISITMLDQFIAKGRGKGGSISNINNYLQAGIAQVQKGDLSGLTGGLPVAPPLAVEDASIGAIMGSVFGGLEEPDFKRSRLS